MSGSLEEAYVAVERAYGQADFAGALQQAEALRPQVPPGRPDLLDQRLQLLIGHIHLYGLNQPAQAAAAYGAVLEGCAEPSYRELAGQGLEISRQQMPAAAEPEAAVPPAVAQPEPSMAGAGQPSASPGQPLPATPWLNQLEDPQLALQQIQQAWGGATPAQPVATPPSAAAGASAASPWQPSETSAASVEKPAAGGEPAEPALTEAGAVVDEEPAPPVEPPAAAAEPPEAADLEGAELAIQPAATDGAGVDDPEAIVQVVVTVEEDEAVLEAEPEPAAAAEPAVAPQPSFSEEEWADFKRGLLLVELTTSNAGPTR